MFNCMQASHWSYHSTRLRTCGAAPAADVNQLTGRLLRRLCLHQLVCAIWPGLRICSPRLQTALVELQARRELTDVHPLTVLILFLPQKKDVACTIHCRVAQLGALLIQTCGILTKSAALAIKHETA